MNNQLTIFDIVDKKQKELLTPEVWLCMKTCLNYNCRFENGSIDRFPSTKEPRCVNASLRSKLVNNVWETKCINYCIGG